MPTLNVVITSFNQKEYLLEAIDSVLNQTRSADRIIIVDDCSIDGSQALIDSFVTRYPEIINAIYHTQNSGVATTRSDGLAAAICDYVTYLDGDDRYLATKLERELKASAGLQDADIVFSNVLHIDSEGTHIGKWVREEKPPQGDIFCETFARDFPNGILFRNELVNYRAWQQVGFYDPEFTVYEDYDMRIRLTKRLRATYVDEPLIEYRRHPKSLRNLDAERKLEILEKIYTKNQHLLDDVEEKRRNHVEGKIRAWRAYLMRQSAKEMLVSETDFISKRKLAAQKYQRSLDQGLVVDLDLISGILLPGSVYKRLRRGLKSMKSLVRPR